jgi:phage major head subunit gpT-like protein
MGAVPWPAQVGGQAGLGGTDGRIGATQVSGLHEGGPITVLGGNERAMVVYPQDWTIPVGMWHNAINDGKVAGLEEWARSAGARFEQHMDYLAFAALNGGDGTTYGKCYDKQVFYYASHVDPQAEYQTAQSNVNALALSLDNFETVRVAGSSFRDDRGQPAGIVHDLIVHAINLERTAAQICDNKEAYDTANREYNPYAGVVRRLTAPGGWFDSTAWIAVCTALPTKPINLQIRQAPTLVFWDDFSQGSGIRYYKWFARYTVFYGDWRLANMGNT